MAKRARNTAPTSAQETLKRKKRQARREAKLMLEIESAKKELTKAQRKESMSQALLKKRRTALLNLEARLEELRASVPEPATETSPSIAELEQPHTHSGLKSSTAASGAEALAQSDHRDQGDRVSLTEQILASPQVEVENSDNPSSSATANTTLDDAEPTFQQGAETTMPEDLAVTKVAMSGDTTREQEAALEHDPAQEAESSKTSTPKVSTARTSRTSRRSAGRGQRTKKPVLDAGGEEKYEVQSTSEELNS